MVDDFNQIYRFSILAFFLWAILSILTRNKHLFLVISLYFNFWVRQLDSGSNSTEIMVLSMAFTWTFLFVFAICEPGECVTKEFDGFCRELERYDWYLLPIDLRRSYWIFLLNAHESINIQCYGRVMCTRETFKKVLVYIRSSYHFEISTRYGMANSEHPFYYYFLSDLDNQCGVFIFCNNSPVWVS